MPQDRAPDRMDHDGVGRLQQFFVAAQQREEKVRILAPCPGEPLIETADLFQSALSGRNSWPWRTPTAPGRTCSVRSRSALVPREPRSSRTRPLFPAERCKAPVSQSGSGMQSSSVKAMISPAAARHPRFRAAAGPRLPLVGQIAKSRERLLPLPTSSTMRASPLTGVVDHDDLVGGGVERLGQERFKAAPQQGRALERGDHDGDRDAHGATPGLVSRKGPSASASSGEV